MFKGISRRLTYPFEALFYLLFLYAMILQVHKAYISKGLVDTLRDPIYFARGELTRGGAEVHNGYARHGAVVL